ncbi:BON domain-containing protein [Paraburkholderia sprentiae WSM5005]|uniref:BON domain-containing protein n=2 Tax=Paraburkholderia sprentiae TaxID=948107 RepID=A0A1I9YKI3_9BURK|nr:BON domain-containing protein [Paraburkholderia sprentiae WSM5005]
MSGGAGAAADVEQRAQILPTEPSTRAHKHLAANKADRKLDSSVNKALARADGLDAQNIHVQAKNGEVTLHGSVPEQSQINRATDVASGVKGVTSVKNALKSEPAGN